MEKKKGIDAIYLFDDYRHNTTITYEQADMIARLLAENKYTHPQIGEMVGCGYKVVENISCGLSYRDLYAKYHLDQRKKTYPNRNEFSDDQVRQICQYFQDHKETSNKSLIFRNLLQELFNMEMTSSNRVYLNLIYNRKRRANISKDYTW